MVSSALLHSSNYSNLFRHHTNILRVLHVRRKVLQEYLRLGLDVGFVSLGVAIRSGIPLLLTTSA
jgi:hypothetical protein